MTLIFAPSIPKGFHITVLIGSEIFLPTGSESSMLTAEFEPRREIEIEYIFTKQHPGFTHHRQLNVFSIRLDSKGHIVENYLHTTMTVPLEKVLQVLFNRNKFYYKLSPTHPFSRIF